MLQLLRPLPGVHPWTPLGDFRPLDIDLAPQLHLLNPPLLDMFTVWNNAS